MPDANHRPDRVIDVFADVSCPFAHFSLKRFVDERARAGADHVHLRVHAWPLELVNGHPLGVDAVADEIDDLRAQVADDLFAGFEASAFPESTIGIIGTATLAYERGIDIGEAFSLAIRDALFEQGQAIGRPDVLAAIAADHGVTVADDATARTAAEADLAEGKTRGVVGSPYFIVDGHEFFCPTLDIQRRGEHLHIAIDHNAFSGFIEHALV